ncbi:hypothetical protein NQZ68_001522 [Dissostichus eleginoides]|nr:hypothetical protein NQZ68_001522 [Dissostichus eleginoides]
MLCTMGVIEQRKLESKKEWEDAGARPRAGKRERKERGDGEIDGVIKIAWVSILFHLLPVKHHMTKVHGSPESPGLATGSVHCGRREGGRTAWEVSIPSTHSKRCEWGFSELSPAPEHPPPPSCSSSSSPGVSAATLPLNKLPSITPKISL